MPVQCGTAARVCKRSWTMTGQVTPYIAAGTHSAQEASPRSAFQPRSRVDAGRLAAAPKRTAVQQYSVLLMHIGQTHHFEMITLQHAHPPACRVSSNGSKKQRQPPDLNPPLNTHEMK